ncbi:hypothetical protein CLF_100975 [Clonorchis sinensis]|uniref:Uncharacterized protein n=1 Tax=Clonorchis sinensis TaxID=79923 RepID=G7Y4P1_CLOSI|nr:hypothetical protein CLF_100975 [Clonorchis sinensis]
MSGFFVTHRKAEPHYLKPNKPEFAKLRYSVEGTENKTPLGRRCFGKRSTQRTRYAYATSSSLIIPDIEQAVLILFKIFSDFSSDIFNSTDSLIDLKQGKLETKCGTVKLEGYSSTAVSELHVRKLPSCNVKSVKSVVDEYSELLMSDADMFAFYPWNEHEIPLSSECFGSYCPRSLPLRLREKHKVALCGGEAHTGELDDRGNTRNTRASCCKNENNVVSIFQLDKILLGRSEHWRFGTSQCSRHYHIGDEEAGPYHGKTAPCSPNDSACVIRGLTNTTPGAGHILRLKFLLHNRMLAFELPRYGFVDTNPASETMAVEDRGMSQFRRPNRLQSYNEATRTAA